MHAIKGHRWRQAEGLSDRDRELCAVAEKLSATPTRITEADWEPLRRLGCDDQALLEVGHVVGLFNYLTWLADGFGLQLDPQTTEAGNRRTPLVRPA